MRPKQRLIDFQELGPALRFCDTFEVLGRIDASFSQPPRNLGKSANGSCAFDRRIRFVILELRRDNTLWRRAAIDPQIHRQDNVVIRT